jgi:hypothetical protein
MTRRSCDYRDLLMQAALQVNPVIGNRSLTGSSDPRVVEPRCLSVFLGFEAARYRLQLRRAGK